jgi:FAD/FMN-containing dehydrogenase
MTGAAAGAGALGGTVAGLGGAPPAAASVSGPASPSASAAVSRRQTWLGRRALVGPQAADWLALRRALSGHHLARPGQPGYDHARELFDPRFDRLRPQGIAYCRNSADVAACLSFASSYGLPVRARSGGHSYAGWSSVTGGLIVDVSQLDHFSAGHSSAGHTSAGSGSIGSGGGDNTSAATGTVRVGAGLALIDLYSRLASRGLAVPGGSCPTVGIAGLTLGGGVGVLSRLYGLTSDNLEAVQIVTASGEVLNCDSGRHSDLLWASRGGGGGNFGIATAFTLRTRELRHVVLFFLSWPWARAHRVVDAWQRWAPHAPDALWSNMHLSAAVGGYPALSVSGAYVGAAAGLAELLEDLYSRVGAEPTSVSVRQVSYLDAMLDEAGCADLSVRQCHTRPEGRLSRQPSLAKSDFFTRRLSSPGIATLLAGIERLRGLGGAQGGAGGIAFDAFGGALNRVHPAATAFVHRDALFLAQYLTSWTAPGSERGIARQHEWLRSCYAALHPHGSGQAYQNYVDPDLRDWRHAYYGQNYARLARIKARYDPHQLLRFPQAITPPAP